VRIAHWCTLSTRQQQQLQFCTVAPRTLLLLFATAHTAAAFHGATPTVARPVHNSSWYTMAWGRSKAPKPDEATLISSLKDAVKAEPQDSSFPVDDACCKRYLRARNHDLTKATAMLRATLRWRAAYGTATIVRDKFPIIAKEAATGKTYVAPGRDKDGRATIIMRSKHENTNDHDGNVLHLVYQMERAVKACDAEEKWNIVIDFNGYAKNTPLKTSKAVLSTMQDHYPERLNKAFLVDAPWLFLGAFKLISPFIDPVTRKKIVFVKGSAEKRAAVLLEHYELDQLEKAVGGASDYVYDAEAYLADDRAAYEAARPERVASLEEVPVVVAA
jgi:hypothetical protein